MTAPLSGLRIIELAGIGPGPFAAMMLADHGAEVIRVERPGGVQAGPEISPYRDILLRSRKRIGLDLKTPEARTVLFDLIQKADGLIEGYRPGVMERLGLEPARLLELNPKLVIGRMTGWGQTGPMAQMAGHDLNYIALSGALHGVGRKGDKPVIPLNLFGDFGGGGMLLAFGMLAALTHARATGQGQVVDAAMTEGVGLLMAMLQTFRQVGIWRDERGVNLLDGGAHFYDTYETADGKYIAVAAIEPKFYRKLLEIAGLADDPAFGDQMNADDWDSLRARLTEVFLGRTRKEWDTVFMGTDACYAPVLSMEEATRHPQAQARGSFVAADGVIQPAPAPRYSHSDTVPPRMWSAATDTTELLESLGYEQDRINALSVAKVID
ncbi:alpha-methylacyl-CoA racemase [Paracoccus thiocyanatus]|uniref:Alpha-methylacyl-CoA racemase n=1 Tax=Paracoccus thiocyanatus TaxID=34006 RepID=A0A1N6XCU7_9RHOB|nr:CaiB/BaiF CoA-transferase family protein [Paracoccus thiocyanatus]SIR00069.1 alpha-methylacyl-CoA racemase [Paracoccus thiocyanatus]